MQKKKLTFSVFRKLNQPKAKKCLSAKKEKFWSKFTTGEVDTEEKRRGKKKGNELKMMTDYNNIVSFVAHHR